MNVFLALDLHTGMTFAIFMEVGTVPVSRDLLIRHNTGVHIAELILFNSLLLMLSGQQLLLGVKVLFDLIECFTTTSLRTHSWLNWVDEDDDEDEVGLKEKPEDTRYIKQITSK